MGTKPIVTQPARTLSQAVQQRSVAGAVTPKGLATVKRTSEIESPYLRLCLYGDIDSLKTTTSMTFKPESSAIILTRGTDQLRPIMSLNAPFLQVTNLEQFQFAALHPEHKDVFGPEWGDNPDRVLILDDITRAKDFALDNNDEGQNNMLVYREATKDIGAIFMSVFRQPQHVIAIALAASYENDISHEENLTPDLPPSMRRLLMADFSYVFYADRLQQKLVTSSKRQVWQGMDEKMRPKTCSRTIFARNKIPKEFVGKGILNQEEPMDLAAIWQKIQAAKGEGR